MSTDRFVPVVIGLSFAFLVASCRPLEPSGETPRPNSDDAIPAYSIEVPLDFAPSAALVPRMEKLCFRVSAVNADGSSILERESVCDPDVLRQSVATITGVTIGAKLLQGSAVDADGSVMATGVLATVIKRPESGSLFRIPNAMPMNPVPQPPPPVGLDRTLEITAVTRWDGEPRAKVSWPEVKPRLSSCVDCHASEFELDLREFPFLPPFPMTQTEIVASIIDRVKRPIGDRQRMPPGNRPAYPAADIALLEQWLADGLLTVPEAPFPDRPPSVARVVAEAEYETMDGPVKADVPVRQSDEPGKFRIDFDDLREASTVRIRLEAFAESGAELGRLEGDFVVSPADEKWMWKPEFVVELPR